MWGANTLIEGAMVFLAARLNEALPSGESEFTLVKISALNALAATVTTTLTQFNKDKPYNLLILLPTVGVIAVANIVGLVVFYLTRVGFDCSLYTLT